MSRNNDVVCFTTPGELDLRVLNTMGFSAKPDPASAIGFFGTGLKFALAVLAREGFEVEIETSGQVHQLVQVPEEIRGKRFQRLALQPLEPGGSEPTPLPFTTELGPHWTLGMVYRELATNTQDEGGVVCFGAQALRTDESQIRVYHFQSQGEEAEKRWFFRPQSAPLARGASVEIWPGPSRHVSFRGVNVLETPKELRFKYNIVGTVKLTEDRTLGYGDTIAAIGGFWLRENTRRELAQELAKAKDYMEQDMMRTGLLDYIEADPDVRGMLLEEFERVWQTDKSCMGKGQTEWLLKHRSGLQQPPTWEPSNLELARVGAVVARLRETGINFQNKITFGLHHGGKKVHIFQQKLYISPEAFESGNEELLEGILTEWIYGQPSPEIAAVKMVLAMLERN